MTNEITTATLYAALASAQSEMEPATIDGKATVKTRTGGSYSYTYASLASVWQSIRKPLTNHGLSIIQRTYHEDGMIHLATILAHKDGGTVISHMPICPIGAPAQEMGSALTYARRYCIAAMVGVVSDEDDDGKAASQTNRHKAPKNGATEGKAEYQPEPGEDIWGDWHHPNHAKSWALSQGVFDAPKHCDNAYEKVKRECKPKDACEMWRCWYKDVMRRKDVKRMDELAAEMIDEPVDDADETPLFD